MCHCSHLTDTTIIITTACPTQLFAILLPTATVLLELDRQLITSLLELQLTDWSLYLVFLYAHTFSLQNIIKVEYSRSRLLEKSIATVCICAFSYMSFPHAYCCWFRCSMYLLMCIVYPLPFAYVLVL